jgi:cell wall-associated NlpC family hydrolase
MQSRRIVAILSVIAPLSLSAQSGGALHLYQSQSNTYPGGLPLAGFGLSLGSSRIAVRGSFGISTETLSGSSTAPGPNSGRWNGDADLVIGTDLLGLGRLFSGLQPYGLIGIGAQSVSASPAFTDAVKTWGYGAGIAVPLSPSIAIQGEMRSRSLINTAIASSDFARGNEYRVGIALRFGGTSARSSGGVRQSGTASGSGGTIWNTSSGVSASGAARRVVPRGEQYIGVPYVWGGDTPKGFDCSGFVQYVYGHEGVSLPRTSRQMAGSGFGVDPNPRSMAVGDLMLFAEYNEPISHVAIYAGNGRFIHSSSSGNGVRYDDLGSGRGQWFREHLVAVRRVATGSGAIVASFAQSMIPFVSFDGPDHAPRVKR